MSFALSSQDSDGWSMHYVWEIGDVHMRLWWGDLRERGHLEDLGIKDANKFFSEINFILECNKVYGSY